MGLKRRIERTMFYNAKPQIFENAKFLRENMTECEKILWEHLSENKLNGFRFKPQHPVNKFIADFYCHKVKLAVEVDGERHFSEEQKEYDSGRDAEFENFGIKILRFTNAQVKNEIQFVLDEIRKALPHSATPTLKGVKKMQTRNCALPPSGAGVCVGTSTPTLKGVKKFDKSF